ncbi:MAG: hypothetical protein SZ59_C0005G0068 [candidate division TM6 bacterium GW2011_GWF2_28_16]|nr:MAG: hypothetical protein SZ59_C0005G0068 [candidate division TM6 bacterium GW2011_GWF2_28_16]
MKTMLNIFEAIQKNIVCFFKSFWAWFKNHFAIFSTTILSLLVVLFFLSLYQEKSYFLSGVITQDIDLIITSLNKIDKECNILNIKNDRNYIDFLNVEKFTSSEVGCLNLAFPKNWQGPYIFDNPTLQGKFYEIIKTKEGYFVVPGKNTKLPNGLITGVDFDFDRGIPVSEMLKVGGCLNFKGTQLAVKLDFEIGDWGTDLSDKKFNNISNMLQEFNKAMPFTYNQTSTTTF